MRRRPCPPEPAPVKVDDDLALGGVGARDFGADEAGARLEAQQPHLGVLRHGVV